MVARFLGLFLATLLVTTSALAQDTSELDPETVERAKIVYKQGAAAFSEARYKDAIDLFLRANRVAPVPAFSFNIGLWSNVSMCDGPPRMCRKIICLARGAWCGCFGASGLTCGAPLADRQRSAKAR